MNRTKLTRNILIGMVLGLFVGSFFHWIRVEDGLVTNFLVDGEFD